MEDAAVMRILEEMRAHFDRIDKHLARHDARFDQIDRRLDQHAARFDQHDARFDHNDARFDRIEAALAKGFSETKAGFAKLREDIGEHFQVVEWRLTKRIDKVESAVNELKASLK